MSNAVRALASSPCASCVAIILALAVARPARGDDPQRDAERWIRHGIDLRKAHDDEGAVREFQKAYDAVQTPRAAGQLGLAEQALGRWEDGERHIRESLQASDDPWTVKNHSILAAAMGIIQSHLGRVEVLGDPAGAEVSVSGRTVGKLPLADAISVSAGEVDVELSAPGYQPAQRTLTIVPGQYQRVVVHLAVVSPPPVAVAAQSAGRAPERTESATPVAPLQKVAEPPVQEPSTTRIGLEWTAAAMSVVSLGLGVAFTIIERQNVAAFESYKTCEDRGGTAYTKGTNMTAPQCQESLNQLLLDQKLAIAGFVAAGVFAGTWAILHFTQPSSPARHTEQALATAACAPSLAGLGIACAVRF